MDAKQLTDQLVHDLPEPVIREALAGKALPIALDEIFHFHCDSGHVHTGDAYQTLEEPQKCDVLLALLPFWFQHSFPERKRFDDLAVQLSINNIHLEKEIGTFCETHGLHVSHDLEHKNLEALLPLIDSVMRAASPGRSMDTALHETATHEEAHHPASKNNHKTLEELFPHHGSIANPKYGWLKDFRDSSAENRAIFEQLFAGPDNHLHYRHLENSTLPNPEHVNAVLRFYESGLSQGFSQQKAFSDGMVASLLGALSPHLKVLGHHYDDMLRVLEYALTGDAKIMYSSLGDDAVRAHQMEAQTGLHIHTGKPIPEVGAVLALTLATTALVEGTGEKLPWAAQTALKAAGVWPLFNHLVRGELSHALAHLKEGTHLQDTVKQMLVSSLIMIGTLKRGGMHEIAAGTVMASILAAIGHIQTNASERSLTALQEVLDSLPQSVQEVHGDHTHTRKLDEIQSSKTIIELKKGDTLPVDVILTHIPSGQSSVLADAYRSRGQMAQRFTIGDRLDQGSVILEEVTLHGQVASSFKDSTIAKQIEEQKTYKPSERQSLAKRVGDNWVWGTVGGTILVTLANILRPLAKGVGIDLNAVLERATSFATLSSPCNILVSTMIEGATTRGLIKEGLIPLRGDAITVADKVTAYALDFTGTCSMGAEFAGATFYDHDGKEVAPELAKELFAKATAVGMKAGSQHIKQKAMRRALFSEITPEEAQTLAGNASDAAEDLGQGVRGRLGDSPIRIGKPDYVAADQSLTQAQQQALASRQETEVHSITHMRVGDYIGVVRFSDRLRDGAKEAIEAMGAGNVYILTGDNNREFILHRTRQLGIPDDHVFTDLSPQAKAEAIAKLQSQGHKVAMVGDGLNDAAPMQKADIAYAMLDTAHDGILNAVDFLTPNLASIAPIKELSRKVNRVSFATLAFSILYTGFTALAEATGLAKMPVIGAAIAHEGVSGFIAIAHQKLGENFVSAYAQERDKHLVAVTRLMMNQPDIATGTAR
jgi:cation transport ATPase